MSTLITVIMTVFNGENFFDYSISSVLNQTYKNFEFIIIDDGSMDNSLFELNKFNDERINIISKKNGGKNSALNLAIENSSGELITIVDQDDYVHPEHLRLLMESLLNNNSDISVCELGIFYTLKELSQITNNTYIGLNNFVFEDLFIGDDILKNFFLTEKLKNPLTNKLFKSAIIKSIVFPEGLILDDLPTLYKLLYYSNRVSYSPYLTYYHYARIGSTSKFIDFSQSYFDQLIDISIEKFYFFYSDSHSIEIQLIVLKNVYMFIAENIAILKYYNVKSSSLDRGIIFLIEFHNMYFEQFKNTFKIFLKKSFLHLLITDYKFSHIIIRFLLRTKKILTGSPIVT